MSRFPVHVIVLVTDDPVNQIILMGGAAAGKSGQKDIRTRRQALERWENEGGRTEATDEQEQPPRRNHPSRPETPKKRVRRVPRERRPHA